MGTSQRALWLLDEGTIDKIRNDWGHSTVTARSKPHLDKQPGFDIFPKVTRS